RYRAGAQDAEEAAEEIEPRGQHHRDAVARPHAQAAQAVGHPHGAVGELGVAHRLEPILAGVEADVGARRVTGEVPVEHLEQAAGGLGQLIAGASGIGIRSGFRGSLGGRQRLAQRAAARVRAPVLRCPGVGNRGEQVARGLGRTQHLGRQMHAILALDAGQQLDTTQAVEAELAVERAVQ
ncbi:hypothetical protein RZS08_09030, partial [Arthrospira platensis SPKY1]|nr:hypothetical protein [Arthrospira platensis SPKY1]